MLVLHTLRCVGAASRQRVAVACGLGEDEVESDLIDPAVEGLVGHGPGPFGGWSVAERGKAADVRWTADELERLGARETVSALHQRFEALNPQVLDLCTDWQVRRGPGLALPNDHQDLDYDQEVLRRLSDVDARAQRLCMRLAEAAPWFGRYGARLSGALDRSLAGDTEYVADRLEAYHTVWV